MASASSYNPKMQVPCDSCVEKLSCKRYCWLFKSYLKGVPVPTGLVHRLKNGGVR